MEKIFAKIITGYKTFREKYIIGERSTIMPNLSLQGQQPQIMVVSCCDSRVDPALILQCDPGDLFVVRNVANIVPPYEKDEFHHGTSAALEFGINILKVKHLILLAHSQCGGIQALLHNNLEQNDFISSWVNIIKLPNSNKIKDIDAYAKLALQQSMQNCLTFPWIYEKVQQKNLVIHLWFFDIKTGTVFTFNNIKQTYEPLS
jgi:carbonic anhydrase